MVVLKKVQNIKISLLILTLVPKVFSKFIISTSVFGFACIFIAFFLMNCKYNTNNTLVFTVLEKLLLVFYFFDNFTKNFGFF